ncbi:MAG: HigA family addiction module antitoxin [Candidatus Palauibacterales bacterium]|nr:HigA family addiction module antitoxin [Candidatus Palauibacterales bacterium]MDP2530821.1 HigA family addiction module antitoxin [Candidatus Palauibacterales bacterium]MDP2583534.1 HigA family addiction module antitoxin [Candidatus Palauibacterales bacterium]
MVPRTRIPTHPGVILLREFLETVGISPAKLARHLGVPRSKVREIVSGTSAVEADMAWLLAGAFGTSPEFWIRLQNAYDLAVSRQARTDERLTGRV